MDQTHDADGGLRGTENMREDPETWAWGCGVQPSGLPRGGFGTRRAGGWCGTSERKHSIRSERCGSQLEAGAGDTDLDSGHIEVIAGTVRTDELSE